MNSKVDIKGYLPLQKCVKDIMEEEHILPGMTT